jgi:hypothetical protein
MVLLKYTILVRLFQFSLPKNVHKIKKKSFSVRRCVLSGTWDSVMNVLLRTALDNMLITSRLYFTMIRTCMDSYMASKWMTVCASVGKKEHGRTWTGFNGLE